MTATDAGMTAGPLTDSPSASNATHRVLNQPPPRVDINEYTANIPLQQYLHSVGEAEGDGELEATGAVVGSAQFQDDARLAHRNPPILHTHNKYGERIDEVEYHPSYHRVIGQAVAAGAHTSAWEDPGKGANALRAAQFMLFAQVEPGHACPVSMSHAAVDSLQLAPELAGEWLPRLYSRQYSPELARGKPGALFGMAMTEKQGGSDVRANTTRAEAAGDRHLLTGHKWFCSAPMSDAFLVLAQDDAGLGCFLVPRVLPDGTRNVFMLQRLKDKVGNRSNASSEVEFANTAGWRIGEPGRGVRAIMGMVGQTRLDCILGTAAGMRQSVAEAVWHTRHRRAFGARLIDQAAMTNVLADLALESEAATVVSMRLSRAFDNDAGPSERAFRRLATAVTKYWVCKRGPNHAYEAMECLGGNGYIEDFPLAMRYREQPVMAIWEGTGNVIALDVLRAMATEPESVEAFFAEVRIASGENRVFDDSVAVLREGVAAVAQAPQDFAGQARNVVERMALALQASLLIRFAPAAVSDAFVDARLGADRTFNYGGLAPSADLAAILARA
ncbi:putative acyl-CoA dehydrogenase [Arthrobacter stackebrandtii]|uniref:Acyl-CoA dehydrogenase n=1 Tax=Arthrobacter stackebrandtii TaxID=272161 RepID=A0ABS4YSH9_9MICC|nr:acyl-CoA dehydrogenase family protein [Arthrobacter stackebrandtii]MBP2411730.1 putative acyl-CoA dehydrogenase [Arthrobacter stackebrandtii]PYG99634.1 DNA alkylation response protein [Arthrobacter stackebrandtii]